MQGIVFDQLRSYALSIGPDVWAMMLERSGVPHRTYLVTDTYPDEEIETLIAAASDGLGRSREEVLTDFGRFLSAGLLAVYGVFLEKRWSLRDVLLRTESTIHRVVRLRDPDADPPRLHISEGRDPDEVVILYDSPRRMCWLGKGIIEGLSAAYATPVDITDVRCMGRGDPLCEISVRID